MTKTLTTLACAALLHAGAAHATDAQFTLAGATDSGPLAGLSFSGSVAYDTSAVVAGFSGDTALTRFTLYFGGQTYSLASADVAPTAAFADGVFLGLSYVDDDSTDTALRPRVALVPGFTAFQGEAYLAYVGAGAAGGYGSYGVSAVPEPAAVALLLAGLGLVGAATQRRRVKPTPC